MFLPSWGSSLQSTKRPGRPTVAPVTRPDPRHRPQELQDLKRTLQNLQQSLHLTWDDAVTDGPDGPDGLAMLLERHQHDANVTLPVELPLRGEMLMANLAVHRKRQEMAQVLKGLTDVGRVHG